MYLVHAFLDWTLGKIKEKDKTRNSNVTHLSHLITSRYTKKSQSHICSSFTSNMNEDWWGQMCEWIPEGGACYRATPSLVFCMMRGRVIEVGRGLVEEGVMGEGQDVVRDSEWVDCRSHAILLFFCIFNLLQITTAVSVGPVLKSYVSKLLSCNKYKLCKSF